jgi:uncharacterized membrane protein
MVPDRVGPSRYTYAAWILSGVGLLLVLHLRLLPAVLAGMLVYELVHLLAPTVSNWLSDRRAKLIAVVLLSVLVVGAISAGIAGAIVFFKSDTGSISTLLTKMAEIVAGSRKTLPSWLVDQMPDNPDDMREALAEWFRVHAREVQSMGEVAGRAVIIALIGMIVGAMIVLHEALSSEPRGPLAAELVAEVEYRNWTDAGHLRPDRCRGSQSADYLPRGSCRNSRIVEWGRGGVRQEFWREIPRPAFAVGRIGSASNLGFLLVLAKHWSKRQNRRRSRPLGFGKNGLPRREPREGRRGHHRR